MNRKLLPLIILVLATPLVAQEYPSYLIQSQFVQEDKTITGHGMCVPIKVKGKKMLLTVAHVARNALGKDADHIFVDFPVGWIRCKVVKICPEGDMCLLEPMLKPPHDEVDLSKKDNEEKQKVINPNYFKEKKITLREGELVIKTERGNWLANIDGFGHGSSGSPVFTPDGKLCGMGIAGVSIDGGKTMTLAVLVGTKQIKEFLTPQSEK